MDKVLAHLKLIDLEKWIIHTHNYERDPDIFEQILVHIECENDNWRFDIDLMADPDFDDGYLGIRNLRNKIDNIPTTGKDFFIINLWRDDIFRSNVIYLLACESFDDFFNRRFSYLEEFETMLRRDFVVKVPIPLRKSDIWVSDSFDNYQIELYSKSSPQTKGEKSGETSNKTERTEVCVILPLAEDNKYRLHFYKHFNQTPPEFQEKYSWCKETPRYDANFRNWCHWDLDEPKNIGFYNVSLDIIVTLMCIQKYHYKHIDKNVFIKIIKELNYLLIINYICISEIL